ncbi:MAG TPA: ABC transporter ATP-binding protein [Syntrophales bacterium]|nr:ABC transporter ATP-binding protein [Syntrophales bacterium]HOX94011.1 ABC transporter ATP-binding protein [Syntrophales bacterium]HPI56361.1 ABC transporter ATP-binding protein [Syntrophales bacterium]HPN24251.1 ABC transporter ATP-binding protein [Syntrophales bacterium]HQM28604.1 ABC transporter ATP-binding protein [Syntrophales bacterium]
MAEPILTLQDVHAGYDGVPVVFGISLEVMPGELVAVVGANGAGKTTTLRAIAGLNNPLQGNIRFEGRDISRLRAHQTLALGISYVPEGRRVFAKLSVEQNLSLGAYTEKSDAEIRRRLEEVLDLFPILRERSRQTAETLSGGEQQMLAIARGLMSRPRLLMLDEMSLGLMPTLAEKMMETIPAINRSGVTVLLVEQMVQEALEIAHRGYVLQSGRIVQAGSAKELLDSEEIRKAYMGM